MDFKVKCVRVKRCPEYFTEGKIYDVVNGSIHSDKGDDFSSWSNPRCGTGRGENLESLNKWFSEWFEFESVEEKKVFTKSDLKTGMFGVTNVDEKFVVVGEHLIYLDGGWDRLVDVRDDLTFSSRKITKVFEGCNSFNHLQHLVESNEPDATLVYDRERDTKPKKPLYNGKVVCIENSYGNQRIYTVGKIYQFKDGILTCDDGAEITTLTKKPFESFEDFANFSASKWIEIKE